MTREELDKLILSKEIHDVDLSKTDLNGIDFAECHLKDVIFSTDETEQKEIANINFKNAVLENVWFDKAVLRNCNFDQEKSRETPSINKVSFRNCEMEKCRFRKAYIQWTDFRYAEITHPTLEEAKIVFCDFYRTYILGVSIFRKSLISNSSLYYTYFDEGANIRKENIFKSQLLQQNKKRYRSFLVDWHKLGTGERKNNQKDKVSNWSPDESLQNRYADAEEIFKTLNGLWMSKGFYSDANWAYVMGRKMERNRMVSDLFSKNLSFWNSLKLYPQIAWNLISDLMFGFGESILKMVVSYVVIIFLFAYLYYGAQEVSLPSYLMAVGISFKNMVAISSDEVQNTTPFIDLLNVMQTTIGILMTGIFGFILGNKIRNQ